MNIYASVKELKGVGDKTCEALNKLGIFTLLDLLLYFPRDYENLNSNIDINEAGDEKVILQCTYKSFNGTIRTRTGKNLTTLLFEYKGSVLQVKYFNQPYIKNSFLIGGEYRLIGKVKRIGNHLEIINPIMASKDIKETNICPKYSLNSAINNKLISKLIHSLIDKVDIIETMPQYIVEKYKFISLNDAIRNIHFPKTPEGLKEAKRRLKFQELLTYSMKILLLKKHIKSNRCGIPLKMSEELTSLKSSLPFSLTNAQTRVVREILLDEKKPVPMNRLVQGDVGSGKTIVAIIAIFNVVKNGYQGVMMAPTEILATQHYNEFNTVLKEFDIRIELLVGSTSKKEKLRIKEKIKSGEPMIVVGTHALLEDDVEFRKLGMIITDEQHRFGVHQRSKLVNKNEAAHVLVMTATPIPRTLSLYVYSDLDISIIDELPPGRQKIDTLYYNNENRNMAYELALNEVNKGRQVYVVSPLIEENEELKLKDVMTLHDEFKTKYFKNVEVGILHGKMKGKEKDEIMTRFKSGEIRVLISTTVIEVGVNVPNASVMIIENAERFGLSQLHQLRGRVGRGKYKSYCILVAKANNNVTKKRMEIMTMSNDGFFIAEQDLKIRGSGDLFGVNQHGEDGLVLSSIIEDSSILKVANMEAQNILNNDDYYDFCKKIINSLEKSTKYICFN